MTHCRLSAIPHIRKTHARTKQIKKKGRRRCNSIAIGEREREREREREHARLGYLEESARLVQLIIHHR
jgi:hypothetical protein